MTSSEADKFMRERPEVAVKTLTPIYSPDVIERALNQSANYHDIVNAYENYRKAVGSLVSDHAACNFVSAVYAILRDDLEPQKCTKCGQELP